MLADNAPNVSIHPGRFVSWYGNDFQRERALACLTGLLGAVGVKGGFVKPKDPRVGRGKSWPHLRHEHGVGNLKEMAGLYPFSPPGTPTDLIRDCAVSGKPYPIKGCITWGQNPIQTIPNQKLTIDMLMQMDFILCVDVMPMDITMYADILLPECSYLERYDFIKRGTQWDLADKNQQQYISARMPLVEPGFECKSGIWITNEIAGRMGYGEHIPVKNQEEMVNLMLKDADLSIEQLKKEDGIHLQPGKDPYGIPEDFEILFYSEDIEDAGFSGVPKYIPVEEPPAGFYRLLFGRSPVHTFNRTMNNSWLMAAMGHNPVWVNDKVAAKLRLRDGDIVSFVNQDGVKSRTTTPVKVTPGIREDAVYMYHGFGSMNPELSIGAGRGVDDQSLITKVAVNPETGAHGMRNNFVKMIKVS